MARNFLIGGTPTKRMQILLYLADKGEATKAEIIKAVWGLTRKDFDYHIPVRRYDRKTGELYLTGEFHDGNTMRGWASLTFCEMRNDGRLAYNHATRKWSLGELGWETIARHCMHNLNAWENLSNGVKTAYAKRDRA